MKKLFLATTMLLALASSANAGVSCRIQGYARGPWAGAWTGWTAVVAATLETCVAQAQLLLGQELDLGNRRLYVVAGKFDFRDGTRVVSGEVRSPGRSGD